MVQESDTKLLCDPSTGVMSPLLTRRNMERFKGPNDLVYASNGDLCESLVSD